MDNYGIRDISDVKITFEDNTTFFLVHCSNIYRQLKYQAAHLVINTPVIPEDFIAYVLHHQVVCVHWYDHIRHVSTGADAIKQEELNGNWSAIVEYSNDCTGDPVSFIIYLDLEVKNESKL